MVRLQPWRDGHYRCGVVHLCEGPVKAVVCIYHSMCFPLRDGVCQLSIEGVVGEDRLPEINGGGVAVFLP